MAIYHMKKETLPGAWTVVGLAETGGDPANAHMDPPGLASVLLPPALQSKDHFCKQISVIPAHATTFPVHSSFDSAGRLTQTGEHGSDEAKRE